MCEIPQSSAQVYTGHFRLVLLIHIFSGILNGCSLFAHECVAQTHAGGHLDSHVAMWSLFSIIDKLSGHYTATN
jgi:hypothetical protein